jgi:hypothetical protein
MVLAVRINTINVVPAKAGIHTPCSSDEKRCETVRHDDDVRWLWVPAFAETTMEGN